MFRKKGVTKPYNRRRQIGTEKDLSPLPYIHEQPSSKKIALSRFYVILTIIFWMIYIISVIFRQLIEGPKSYQFTLEVISYVIVVTFLTFSALMYLVARQGAFQRFSKHLRVPRALLERYFSENQPSITVLIPSYNEEPEVIRKTILSAALQEYPNIRVVLLMDDDEKKVKPENREKFEKTKALSTEIMQLLSEPYNRFTTAFENWKQKNSGSSQKTALEIADEYYWASNWLNKLANQEKKEDHVDVFFADQVLRDLAKDLSRVGDAIKSSYKERAKLTSEAVEQLYKRLIWIFGAELDVFERKKYASLSNEPNKAMNLNSYIGLMGGSYNKVETDDGVILVPSKKKEFSDIDIPDSDFLLTLDADSVLLKDYCLRLVYFLQQPDNADVAVTQTPYSSFRGAPTRIERLAGATTDVQHILHQGMSYYNATFWVGANAVIRKKALKDIEEREWVGGFEIKRYVQDRTVIEDTESSIDIALHGWRLVNYPERLSYSATPPDFGSLVVQRRRWANGGLLIMPKLFSKSAKLQGSKPSKSLTEFLLRINYMASIAWSNLGLVFLLAYPYDGRLLSPLVLLAAMPYFIAMASDLKYCRYSYFDVIRIYGFNLILLPVNIAGVFKSFQQALTTKKIPFARTPKIKDRTAAGIAYVVSPLLVIGFSLFTLWRNIEGQNWGNAAFAGFNAFAASWAVFSYIGIDNLFVDIWFGIKEFLYVEVNDNKNKKQPAIKPAFDWRTVLYHGDEEGVVPYHSLNDLVVTKRKGSAA